MSNNNSMKQIPFSLEAFGPDGLLKEGYEPSNDIEYIKYFQEYDRLAVIYKDGSAGHYRPHLFTNRILYRRNRTAEEVARDWSNSQEGVDVWSNLPPMIRKIRTSLIQAGMDEMKNS